MLVQYLFERLSIPPLPQMLEGLGCHDLPTQRTCFEARKSHAETLAVAFNDKPRFRLAITLPCKTTTAEYESQPCAGLEENTCGK